MGAFRPHFLLSLILVAVLNTSSAPPSGSETMVERATNMAASAATRFAFDLMKSLVQSEGNGKNIFFSPYSISAAASMTSLAASGKTLEEIQKSFYFNDVNAVGNKVAIHEVYKNLLQLYNAENANYILTTANRLFADDTFKVRKSFQKMAKKYYHADLKQLDFKSGEAEDVINKWVEGKTNNKIKNLFKSGSLADAVVVLVNAIYFKGTWKKQFDAADTQQQEFHLSSDQTKQLDMMYLKHDFNYAYDPELKAKMLEMPYLGDQLSMIAILPDEIDGLSAVIQQLTDDKFDNLVDSMTLSPDVMVEFPKFKLETEYSLVETLGKLGIHDLFEDWADLSPLSESPTKVSQVLHKCFLEVDEVGTTAAAVTGMVGAAVGASAKPTSFIADHPFLIFLFDNCCCIPLFVGVVNVP